MTRRPGPAAVLACFAALGALDVSAARAQVLERNLPPAPTAPPATLPQTSLAAPSNDTTPLGPTLHALVIIGGTGEAASSPPEVAGVSFQGATRLGDAGGRTMLRRFLGRPLSRKLISEIEIAIVKAYRRRGFPFVDVSTPEQEITEGVLEVRVVEFRLGKLTVKGVSARKAAAIAKDIRLASGDPISSPKLLQDLDWLDRYPFRTIQPQVSPGAEPGETNLTLVTTERRPWRIYGGYSNSGTLATGIDRVFVGGTVGSLLVPDSLLSAQITGSPDFWAAGGHPLYESAAIQAAAPVGARQMIELSLNAVETNEPVQAFVVRQETLEATFDYKAALSNVVALPGDVALGEETALQERHTLFGPAEIASVRADVFQLFAAWSDAWATPSGQASLLVSVHGSPGRLDPFNTDASFSGFTQGRVSSAGYVYGALSFGDTARLTPSLTLVSQVDAQYAGQPLPDSQQMPVGGEAAVRGYTLDDGAFDDAVVVREELHPPAWTARWSPVSLRLAPYVFTDGGYGYDQAARRGLALGSAGAGFDGSLGQRISASVDAAYAYEPGKLTERDSWRVNARVSVAY